MMLKKKNLFRGQVIAKKMEKTATVVVERVYRHPIVQKVVRRKTKFHVHDPLNQTMVGDEILFYEGPHISKIKYMYFHEKVNSQNIEK
jgi:small subunit ribosomal protein S17